MQELRCTDRLVFEYARMQEYRYTNRLVFVNASMQVFKYACMEELTYQVCYMLVFKDTSFKYARIRVC